MEKTKKTGLMLTGIAVCLSLAAGCGPGNPLQIDSGNAYAKGTISASGVTISTNILAVYIGYTKYDCTNTNAQPNWMIGCTNLPQNYIFGYSSGIYYIYAWLDYNKDNTNNSGDYEGWYGGNPGSPNANLVENQTNTFNLSLTLK